MSGAAQRVVVAPDSFKGTVSAADAAAAIGRGWRSVRGTDDVVLRPMADGGEGTVDALVAAVRGASVRSDRVTGPLGSPVDARWALLPDGAAVLELAQTSGLARAPRRDATGATSRGFGELIRIALEAGAVRLLLGVGGSACSDGGAGVLEALGVRILDGRGRPVPRGNAGLGRVATVDRAAMIGLPPGGATVLTDVDNPLLGDRGAIAVFAPQKGAAPDQLPAMEARMAHWARRADLDTIAPGGGAGGGVGAALLSWGAQRASGAAFVADAVGLADAVRGADLVITGEGRFDRQTAGGKAPHRVAAIAAAAAVPVAVVAGSWDRPPPVTAVSLTLLAGSSEAAMADAPHWLERAGATLATSHTPRAAPQQ